VNIYSAFTGAVYWYELGGVPTQSPTAPTISPTSSPSMVPSIGTVSFVQQDVFTSFDGVATDRFGISMSLDGDTLMVADDRGSTLATNAGMCTWHV
jgi:hypothetical protein